MKYAFVRAFIRYTKSNELGWRKCEIYILDFNRLGWFFSESLKENHTTKEEALSEKRGKYDHSFFLSLDVLNEKRAVISIHIHTFETFHLTT